MPFSFTWNQSIRRKNNKISRQLFVVEIMQNDRKKMVYLLHFETFLCCFVVAAAWLLNIIFVDFHSVCNSTLNFVFKNKRIFFLYSRRTIRLLFQWRTVTIQYNTESEKLDLFSVNTEHGPNDVCVCSGVWQFAAFSIDTEIYSALKIKPPLVTSAITF